TTQARCLCRPPGTPADGPKTRCLQHCGAGRWWRPTRSAQGAADGQMLRPKRRRRKKGRGPEGPIETEALYPCAAEGCDIGGHCGEYGLAFGGARAGRVADHAGGGEVADTVAR